MNPNPILSLSLLSACLLATSPLALAQSGNAAPAKQVAKAATKAPAAKKPVSQSRMELQSEAKGLALASEVTESISEQQIALGSRVLTGTAHCEFDQRVSVDAMTDKPGHFRVAFKGATYTMVPHETTTGAVRLEDRRNGIVWLQIPAKSMMMNHKVGQRMVDGCMHAEQRAAVAAVNAAGR